MLEIAIVAAATYLGRKACGMLGRAGSELDAAVDQKLSEIYEFLKAKLISLGVRGERALRAFEERPDDERTRSDALQDVAVVLEAEPASVEALQRLTQELKALDVNGSYLRGYAAAREVDAHGQNVGVDIENTLPRDGRIEGTASAEVVRGDNIGIRYRPSP